MAMRNLWEFTDASVPQSDGSRHSRTLYRYKLNTALQPAYTTRERLTLATAAPLYPLPIVYLPMGQGLGPMVISYYT